MIDLYHGDCLEIMDELIEKGITVDAIICDPPYGTTSCKWDVIIPFDEMWQRLHKLVKYDGAIVLFGSEPFSSYCRISNIKNFKYDWKFKKQQAVGHLNAKKQPMRDNEDIMVFYSKQCAYNPQMEKSSEKSKGTIKTSSVNNYDDRVYGSEVNTEYIDNGLRYPKTTIENMYDSERFDSKNKREYRHPTQKPVSIIQYLVRTYTNKNDVVMDFTMGSGTTGVACKYENRDFIGIEKDEYYFNMAKKRIKETMGLFG